MKEQSLKELSEEWGIDFQTVKIKTKLIDKIVDHCKKTNISQRKLAKLVPGLTQDRISKIFSGQVSHMTIDKLIQIMTILEIRVTISVRGKAA